MERKKALSPSLVKRTREAIETLYDGICTVEIKESIKDPETKKNKSVVKTVLKEVPCRLSHESNKTGETRTLTNATQTIMLFIAPQPEVIIPSDSKITITQDSVTEVYANSGVSNNFPTHQEIELEKWEKWA